MRIIAGEHRGRTLRAPKGDGTRPTTDRVRESLMSMVASARGGFDGAVVLDAFAGSGALGLEALSRGGAWACLAERDGAALRVVRGNAQALGYGPDRLRVAAGDVLGRRVPRPPRGKGYDLVFLDPPYALPVEEALGLLARAADEGALAAEALASYEHDAAASAAVDAWLAAAPFRLRSRRSFGDTVIDIMEREEHS